MIRSVTCLIPAHNEAPRIAGVLEAVRDHPRIAQVIVVDDGSSDDTADVAARCGVDVLRLSPNRGKSAAIAAGLSRVTTSHVLLLDADLTGLRAADLSDLIAPVQAGRADATLSLRGNAPRLWHWLGVDYITGERVLPMAMLTPCLAQIAALPRFGLEVFLNTRIRAARLRVAIVRWPDVASPAKGVKRGWRAGLWADAAMIRDILRTVPLTTVLGQILYLRSRNG
jgi:glycosyltransferase involved in cell wall biosynthesis